MKRSYAYWRGNLQMPVRAQLALQVRMHDAQLAIALRIPPAY